MSSASSSRASRRQVLAVGPVAMESGIGVDPVGSIFEALGIIAKCPASRPVDAVLLAPGDGETLEDLVHAAQALRRLDATVQVILVGSQPLGPSIAEQFDGLTPSPVDEQRLKHVLDGVPISDALPAASTPVVVEPPSAPEPSAPPAASTPPTTPPPIDASTAPTAAETPSGLGRLGDTDLVEAMLHDASGVLPVALRLILQQTGWSDCAVSMEEDGAPIRFGSSDFGQLISAGQPTAALRPWANWLARWLALDEAQRELRDMAFRDELTTAWNRRYLASFLEEAIEEARQLRRQLTVLVFDIDDFKSYNDRFGHAAGDTILQYTVQLLGSVIREGDRVCRIGGDEFAVVFADLKAPRHPGTAHPDTVEAIARRFQEQVCAMRFPELGLDAPGTLSISGGLASFPWDGHDGSTLIRIADERALESKRRGKNCLTIGPGARSDWPDM